MEIKHIVDGKIVSINGVPVNEVVEVVVPTPTPNEEINIEESANTETESGSNEE
jgi:hypothetical protein